VRKMRLKNLCFHVL